MKNKAIYVGVTSLLMSVICMFSTQVHAGNQSPPPLVDRLHLKTVNSIFDTHKVVWTAGHVVLSDTKSTERETATFNAGETHHDLSPEQQTKLHSILKRLLGQTINSGKTEPTKFAFTKTLVNPFADTNGRPHYRNWADSIVKESFNRSLKSVLSKQDFPVNVALRSTVLVSFRPNIPANDTEELFFSFHSVMITRRHSIDKSSTKLVFFTLESQRNNKHYFIGSGFLVRGNTNMASLNPRQDTKWSAKALADIFPPQDVYTIQHETQLPKKSAKIIKFPAKKDPS